MISGITTEQQHFVCCAPPSPSPGYYHNICSGLSGSNFVYREEEENVNGGYWKMRCPKGYTVSEQVLAIAIAARIFFAAIWLFCVDHFKFLEQDKVWKELLLAAIGEQFANSVREGNLTSQFITEGHDNYNFSV